MRTSAPKAFYVTAAVSASLRRPTSFAPPTRPGRVAGLAARLAATFSRQLRRCLHALSGSLRDPVDRSARLVGSRVRVHQAAHEPTHGSPCGLSRTRVVARVDRGASAEGFLPTSHRHDVGLVLDRPSIVESASAHTAIAALDTQLRDLCLSRRSVCRGRARSPVVSGDSGRRRGPGRGRHGLGRGARLDATNSWASDASPCLRSPPWAVRSPAFSFRACRSTCGPRDIWHPSF